MQPGGNDQQMRGKANLLRYINSAHYLGTSWAGWFVASSDYVWQGKHYAWPNTLESSQR